VIEQDVIEQDVIEQDVIQQGFREALMWRPQRGIPTILMPMAILVLAWPAAHAQGDDETDPEAGITVPAEPLDPGLDPVRPQPDDVLAPDDTPVPREEDRQARPTPHQPLDRPMAGEDPEFVIQDDDEYLMGELMGAAMTSRDGEDFATLQDLILGPGGEVVAVVAETDGFFGIGARRIALDWDVVEITPGPAPPQIVVNLDRRVLDEAPDFAGD